MADMPGEITGGTECYGRRYSCGDPLTSPTEMSSRLLLVAFTQLAALIAQHNAFSTDCPSDLLVEIQRVKVLLGC